MNCKNYPEFSDHYPEKKKTAGSREINKKLTVQLYYSITAIKNFLETFCKGHFGKDSRKY